MLRQRNPLEAIVHIYAQHKSALHPGVTYERTQCLQRKLQTHAMDVQGRHHAHVACIKRLDLFMRQMNVHLISAHPVFSANRVDTV